MLYLTHRFRYASVPETKDIWKNMTLKSLKVKWEPDPHPPLDDHQTFGHEGIWD